MSAGSVKTAAFALALIGFTELAVATPKGGFYGTGPASIQCVIEAARRQGVPANIMLAIASVEGGKNGQRVRNTNGTYDIGHFQLNTMHFDEGGMFTRVGIKAQDAAWRGCYNAELAAWIVRKQLDKPGSQDYWVRVANYHSATPKFNAIYRSKLIPLADRWGRWLQSNYKTTITYH